MPAIIVLAAGASRRLGRPKQLEMWEGETLLDRAIRVAGEVSEDVIVVVAPHPAFGHPLPAARGEGLLGPSPRGRGEGARSADEGRGRFIENPNRDEGMSSSIRAGVQASTGDVLIMLCDQPLITPEHLRALIDANAPIAATGYNGISGVPAFFAAKFRDELLALRGDVGAKSIIERHRSEVVTIPFEAAALDVDL